MERLPTELIQDILYRNDADEIRGLCNSSSSFREQCNYLSKHILQTEYHDDYELYLSLHQYYICIVTSAGQTKFTNIIGLNNITKAFKNLMRQLEQRMQRDTDITWIVDDSENPKMMSIKFHYYSDVDCVENFDVIIQGDFRNHTNVEYIANGLFETFQEM